MNLILFDDIETRNNLKPLSLTRPVADLRCGIFTIAEKWKKRMSADISFLTVPYLSEKYKVKYSDDNYYINSSILPEDHLIEAIISLQPGESLFHEGVLLVYKSENKLSFPLELPSKRVNYFGKISRISELTHLFLENGVQILADFELINSEESGQNPDSHTVVYHPKNVFFGKNVNVKAAVINAEGGPVYIGDNAVIKEGSVIIGPAVVGENAMVGLGAKIRENTTIGPCCRVAGEVKNTVFHSYSNKAHDGFLGNSYIGSGCNLGANTNNSNLKNNLKTVSLYSYPNEGFYDTGEVYCGTFMGDYTKTGINTMLNTGTVTGVAANIFGAGFQSKFIPDFSWGGAQEGYTDYIFDKAVETINATMAQFKIKLSSTDIKILQQVWSQRK